MATGLASPAIYVSGSDFACNFDVTGSITAQTSSTVSTLRFAGSNTLTLSSGQTLTIRTGAAGTDGGILAAGGSSMITGGTVTTGGVGTLFIRVDGGSDQLTLAAVPPAGLTGGLAKSGAGVLVPSGSNLQVTGTTSINEGTVRLSGGSSRLSGANVVTSDPQGGWHGLTAAATRGRVRAWP